MEFEKLVNSIQSTHEELQLSAIKAVNQSLTLRNWLIGLYIVEFEQNGEDRARYGDRLMPELAKSLKIKGLSETNLKLCRLFYTAYPHLDSGIKSVIKISHIDVLEIRQPLTNKLQTTNNKTDTIRQTLSNEFNLVQKTQVDQENQHLILPTDILSKLSFSHLVLHMKDDIFDQIFIDEKYGTYLRNIEGVIEHSYYHLGQISLIKKLIMADAR